MQPTTTRILVIGAGFGGLGAAIQLRRHGYRDFLVLDRSDEIGGTWRDNRYPGCACDIPSHLYSYSFAPNPQWTHRYPQQPEIWAYLRRCVHQFGLAPHLRLGHEVRSAVWQPDRRLWLVQTSRGPFTAGILVVAAGPFSEPALPALPGLATFHGQALHSSAWPERLDLTGRRVAVIGTGASAVQIVPAIASTVDKLVLFQRTPAWIVPRRDAPIGPRHQRLYRAVPAAQRLVRAGGYWLREAVGLGFVHPAMMRGGQALARRHLHRQIADPALRERLTPGYTMGCKRVLISDDFYPALLQGNVELVTEPIAEVRPGGVVTSSGVEVEVDTLVFGTGFTVTDPPIAQVIRGAGGRTLAEAGHGRMQAYHGITVAGFPNLFLLLGPNTGLGHNSVVFMIECQLHYLLGALRHLDRTGLAAIEPTAAAQARFLAAVDRRMTGTVWLRGGCHSWYLDAAGRNSTLWPGSSWSYWLRTRWFDPTGYRSVGPGPNRPAADQLSADQLSADQRAAGGPEVDRPAANGRPRVVYERRGRGEPLVLLHGIGHHWRGWTPVLDRLAQVHDVIAVDLPGFGRSPVPTDGVPDMPGTVAAIGALFEELGIGRPHVAGNSLGGAIALELGAAGLAASVTAFAPAGFATRWQVRRALSLLAVHRFGTHLPVPVLRTVAGSAALRSVAYGMIVGRPDQLSPEAALADAVAMRRGKGFRAVARMGRRYTFDADPAVPVTIAWGSRDRILSRCQAAVARYRLPLARHVELPGCGHVPMSDDPDLVADVILATTGAGPVQPNDPGPSTADNPGPVR